MLNLGSETIYSNSIFLFCMVISIVFFQVIDDIEQMLDKLKPCLVTVLEYYKELHPSWVTKENAEHCDAWQQAAATS